MRATSLLLFFIPVSALAACGDTPKGFSILLILLWIILLVSLFGFAKKMSIVWKIVIIGIAMFATNVASLYVSC